MDLESDSTGSAVRPVAAAGDQEPGPSQDQRPHLQSQDRYAHTSERIEFRIPEAVGSAVGATYDSQIECSGA